MGSDTALSTMSEIGQLMHNIVSRMNSVLQTVELVPINHFMMGTQAGHVSIAQRNNNLWFQFM